MCLLPGSPALRMGDWDLPGQTGKRDWQESTSFRFSKGRSRKTLNVNSRLLCAVVHMCTGSRTTMCLHTRDKGTRTLPTHTCVKTKNIISNHLWRNSAAKGQLRQVSIRFTIFSLTQMSACTSLLKLCMCPAHTAGNSKIFRVLSHSVLLICLSSAFEVLTHEITYVSYSHAWQSL